VFESLRVRNYRLFAAGQVVSLTGSWMQRVGQDWLVTSLAPHGAAGTDLGITTALQFLPVLLFGLYGGVIADRYPKRRMLVWTQSVMGALALALGLLVMSHSVQLWHVYLLAFLLGLATAADSPIRQAFVSELVGSDHLANAVALNSATFNTARVIGPVAAGFLVAAMGTGPVFLLNAASFIAVIVGLALMRDQDLFTSRRVARAPGQLRAGLRYVVRRPNLLYPIILVGVLGTFGFNFQMTMALIARLTFHRAASAYGLLSAALAVGSLIGALLAARRSRPRQRLLLGAALAFGVLEVLTGLMPTYLSFFALLVPTGVAVLTFTTAANSSVQLGASPNMRGRVMALYLLVFMGGTPIGAPIVGWLADVLGPRYSLIFGGAISFVAAAVVAVIMLRVHRMRLRAHLRGGRPHLHLLPAGMPAVNEPVYDPVRSAS
jgi:MFS family permease